MEVHVEFELFLETPRVSKARMWRSGAWPWLCTRARRVPLVSLVLNVTMAGNPLLIFAYCGSVGKSR